MENNNNDEKEDLKNFKITYKLRSGEVRRFNVSKDACEPFGFHFGERIKVRGNKRAWVVGVSVVIDRRVNVRADDDR